MKNYPLSIRPCKEGTRNCSIYYKSRDTTRTDAADKLYFISNIKIVQENDI